MSEMETARAMVAKRLCIVCNQDVDDYLAEENYNNGYVEAMMEVIAILDCFGGD